MSEDRKFMKLGVSMRGHGYHANAWQHPQMNPASLLDFGHFLKIVKVAEAAVFDMAFLADYVALSCRNEPQGVFGRDGTSIEFEPVTLHAALATHTTNIGLVATMSASYQEPYHIARLFASLDHLSGGRAAWNCVVSGQEEEARNFGMDKMLPKDARYERAREAVEVVLGLWDSWDEDAFVRDKASGVYFDPGKMRSLNHKGKYFQVDGPLIVPRTPQGRPLVVQAGTSEDGQDLAARTADIVYAAFNVLTDAQAFYKAVKDRLPAFGRHPDDIKIMPGILPIIGETVEEAQAKYQQMKETIDPQIGMGMLTAMFGDLSDCDIDGPLPARASEQTWRSSRIAVTYDLAVRNNLSIRQLYQQAFIGNAHNVVVGTPEMVADTMEEWFTQGGADGFNVLPAYSPFSFFEFAERVVPILQQRGLTRTEYAGPTMRENMQLPPPKPVRIPQAA